MEGKLDVIDRQIMAILERDAKTSAKEIASQLNMTKTPIYERIRRLENEGYISKYVAILDKSRIESSITVFSFVSLEAQKGQMNLPIALNNTMKLWNALL